MESIRKWGLVEEVWPGPDSPFLSLLLGFWEASSFVPQCAPHHDMRQDQKSWTRLSSKPLHPHPKVKSFSFSPTSGTHSCVENWLRPITHDMATSSQAPRFYHLPQPGRIKRGLLQITKGVPLNSAHTENHRGLRSYVPGTRGSTEEVFYWLSQF